MGGGRVMAVAKAVGGWRQAHGCCQGCRWVAAGSWLLPRLQVGGGKVMAVAKAAGGWRQGHGCCQG